MIISTFLWANVLLNSFHFAAHLYDSVAGIPNWQSGEVRDVTLYRDFHHRAKKAYFFAPVIFLSIAVSLISLVLVWSKDEDLKTGTVLTTFIPVITLISVFTLFRPINVYIEKTKQYDVVKLKALVKRWVLLDRIRLIVVLIGLATAIWTLQKWKG